MEIRLKTLCITILTIFIVGIGFVFLGIAKGTKIAVSLSRPWGAKGWDTSTELVNACTYIPIGVGCFLLILALVFSIVTFIKFVRIK